MPKSSDIYITPRGVKHTVRCNGRGQWEICWLSRRTGNWVPTVMDAFPSPQAAEAELVRLADELGWHKTYLTAGEAINWLKQNA